MRTDVSVGRTAALRQSGQGQFCRPVSPRSCGQRMPEDHEQELAIALDTPF